MHGNGQNRVLLYDADGVPVPLGQGTAATSLPFVPASDAGTGSITTLNGAVAVLVAGAGTVTFRLSGTFVASIGVEGTVDNVTWVPIIGTIVGTQNEFVVAYATGPVTWSVPCGGYQRVRVTAVTYTSGTINVQWNAGAGQFGAHVHNLDYDGLRGRIKATDELGTANLTGAGQTIVASIKGLSSITLSVYAVFVGTAVFEANVDGTLWFPVKAYRQETGEVTNSTATTGTFTIACGGFQQVRVRCSAYTSGTISVVWNAGLGQNVIPTQPVHDYEDPTFVVSATAVAMGNNKSMLSIFNTDTTLRLRVLALWLINTQTAAVTGILATFELRRLTGAVPSAGTDLTTTGVEQHDTADAKNTNWTVRTGATVGTEATKLLRRVIWSSDEYAPGTADVESADHVLQQYLPLWSKNDATSKPLVLRVNEGLTVKCATNSTVGTWDIFALVAQET